MFEEINRKDFHEAIDATLSGLQADPWLAQRVVNRERKSEPVVKKKLSISLVLGIVLLVATIGVAFALTNGFGLLDFIGINMNVEIPQTAWLYIDTDIDTVTTEHFTVNIRERYYDGITLHFVYDVIPKDKRMLLFDKPADEYWYALTHLEIDRVKMINDGRTILDRWEEGDYASAWIVDVSVDDAENNEFIRQYSDRSVLNEETSIFTGHVEVPMNSIKAERNIAITVAIIPLNDIHDEDSWDYKHAEYAAFKRVFEASVTGEEMILCNSQPILIPKAEICIDRLLLMILPQEIQYKIIYSPIDSNRFHSLYNEYPEDNNPIIVHPWLRFVSTDPETNEVTLLSEGITSNFSQYDIDTELGIFLQTGSIGRSNKLQKYSLAVLTSLIDIPLDPVDIVDVDVVQMISDMN